jgi:hypothetical protein
MKKALLFSVMALIVVAFLFSGLAVGQGQQQKPKRKAVEASGLPLWEHLKKVDYRKKWKMWPGKEAFYKGQEPHGVFLTTYVNGPALRGIGSKRGAMPDGAIITKENYSPEKKLIAITVMFKVKGYNPEAGNWFWVKYTPDGKVEAEGKVEGCIKCHAQKRANDFLFAGPLK